MEIIQPLLGFQAFSMLLGFGCALFFWGITEKNSKREVIEAIGVFLILSIVGLYAVFFTAAIVLVISEIYIGIINFIKLPWDEKRRHLNLEVEMNEKCEKCKCCNSAKVLSELMSELNELIKLSKTCVETPSYIRTLIFAYETAQASIENLEGGAKNE